MFFSYVALKGLLSSPLPSLTTAHQPPPNSSASPVQGPFSLFELCVFLPFHLILPLPLCIQKEALTLRAPFWGWVRQLPPFEWVLWFSASSVTLREVSKAWRACTHPPQSLARGWLPRLAGREQRGRNYLQALNTHAQPHPWLADLNLLQNTFWPNFPS